MPLYDRIKELCDNRGLAVTALEKELGWGRGSIGKLKKGGSIASDRLQLLAEYFQVSTDYLLEVPNSGQVGKYYINEEAAQYAQAIFEDPDLKALFHAAQGIRKEDQKLLVNMALRFKETNSDG